MSSANQSKSLVLGLDRYRPDTVLDRFDHLDAQQLVSQIIR
jgi:hypothetical protein